MQKGLAGQTSAGIRARNAAHFVQNPWLRFQINDPKAEGEFCAQNMLVYPPKALRSFVMAIYWKDKDFDRRLMHTINNTMLMVDSPRPRLFAIVFESLNLSRPSGRMQLDFL